MDRPRRPCVKFDAVRKHEGGPVLLPHVFVMPPWSLEVVHPI
jgi:hypothetical protein